MKLFFCFSDSWGETYQISHKNINDAKEAVSHLIVLLLDITVDSETLYFWLLDDDTYRWRFKEETGNCSVLDDLIPVAYKYVLGIEDEC